MSIFLGNILFDQVEEMLGFSLTEAGYSENVYIRQTYKPNRAVPCLRTEIILDSACQYGMVRA